MDVKELLSELHLGNSVAEFDEDLERYFVETNVFDNFVSGKADIVAGDKGTGKTALYKYILDKSDQIDELDNTTIITGYNIKGSPVFQRLAIASDLT